MAVAPLDGLDLVGLLLEGVHVGEHCLIVARGVAADGEKHASVCGQGPTENATLCQSLLANLQSRGLRTDRSLLVIVVDGSKALRKAVRDLFGEVALVQRCQIQFTVDRKRRERQELAAELAVVCDLPGRAHHRRPPDATALGDQWNGAPRAFVRRRQSRTAFTSVLALAMIQRHPKKALDVPCQNRLNFEWAHLPN